MEDGCQNPKIPKHPSPLSYHPVTVPIFWEGPGLCSQGSGPEYRGTLLSSLTQHFSTVLRGTGYVQEGWNRESHRTVLRRDWWSSRWSGSSFRDQVLHVPHYFSVPTPSSRAPVFFGLPVLSRTFGVGRSVHADPPSRRMFSESTHDHDHDDGRNMRGRQPGDARETPLPLSLVLWEVERRRRGSDDISHRT